MWSSTYMNSVSVGSSSFWINTKAMAAAELSDYLTNQVKSIGFSPITPYLLAAIIAIFVLKEVSKKKYKLPPGPKGLPIVGYAPFLGDVPHEALTKLCQKYGNVIGFYIGGQYTVVAGDYAAVKEVFSKDEFLDRPDSAIVHKTSVYSSVIIANGQVWKQQRRFALQTLRDLGFGKGRMEDHIQEEILCFMKELEKQGGKPADLRLLLSISTSNNIRFLLFGHRLEYDDPKSIEMEKYMVKQFTNLGKAQFRNYLPMWAKYILPLLGAGEPMEEVLKGVWGMNGLVADEVREHKETFQDDHIRDYVDGFLLEMKKNLNGQSSFNDNFLQGNAVLYFLAGSDTLRTTLSWAFLLMAVHQDVQERAYEEIIQVLGKERMPSWSDHTSLPYCEAVIAEVHRYKTIVPLGVDRSPATNNTKLQGYDVPKGTVVLTNLWAVHMDPTYWKNPERFDPTRFLSSDGKTYNKSERVMPFSTGKRSCPGETMAHVETFLYFASLLQRFKILPMPEHKVDLEGTFELTYQPKTIENLYFQRRIC